MKRDDFKKIIKLRSIWKIDRRMDTALIFHYISSLYSPLYGSGNGVQATQLCNVVPSSSHAI